MDGSSAVYSSPFVQRLEQTQAELCLSGALTPRESVLVSRRRLRSFVRDSMRAHRSEVRVRWDRFEALRPDGFKLEAPSPREEEFWTFVREVLPALGGEKPMAPRKRGRPPAGDPTPRQRLFESWELTARWNNPAFPSTRKLFSEIVQTDGFANIYNKFREWLAEGKTGRIDRAWVDKIVARFSGVVPGATYEALRDAGKTSPEDDEENERMSARRCAMDRIYARSRLWLIGSFAHMDTIFETKKSVADRDLLAYGFPHPGITGAQWLTAARALDIRIEFESMFLAGLENIERVLVDRVHGNVPVSFWEICLNARPVDFSAKEQFYAANPLPHVQDAK